MRELPFDLRFEVGERRIHLVRGSPRKVDEYRFEDKPARLYERLVAGEDADTLVFGHTHKPWIDMYGGVLFVNCGSVGKPKDGAPRGACAVLDLDDDGRIAVRIERVEYDAETVARELARRAARRLRRQAARCRLTAQRQQSSSHSSATA